MADDSDEKIYPRWLRRLLEFRPWVLMAAIALAILSGCVIDEIDRQAFRQPTAAVDPYIFPERIKSGIFYLTATQEWQYRTAQKSFIISILTGYAFGFGINALKRRYGKAPRKPNSWRD